MAQVAALQINITGYGQPAYAETRSYGYATSPLAVSRGYAFSTGFQTITKPTGAKGVFIRNMSSGGTLTIKGINGDTGFAIAQADADLFPIFIPVLTTLTVTASASLTADLVWI